jgi:hypothetical protein
MTRRSLAILGLIATSCAPAAPPVADPEAIADVAPLLEPMEPGPDDVVIRVLARPEDAPAYRLDGAAASLDAVRAAVATRSGRIVVGAEPRALMGHVMAAIHAAHAGRAARPAERQLDVEVEAFP